MNGKLVTVVITAFMLISLISVFQAGTASAQVPPPTNINIVVDNDWENDEQVKAGVGENFTWGETAFAKIQDAIDNASPNDNIHMYPGTYKENVTVNVENLTLIGVGGPRNTVLDASGCYSGFSVQAAGATIDNFAVANADIGIEVYGENIEGGSVTIRNNVLENNYTQGIFFDNTILNSAVTTENNSISNNGNQGILFLGGIENSEVGITGNTIDSNGQQGIYFYSSIENSEVEVTGNTVDNNRLRGIVWRAIRGSHVLIENNSISNNGMGIIFDGGIKNSVVGVTGNTVDYNDSGIWINQGVDATGVAVNYNGIVGNIQLGVNNRGTGTLDATYNWWGDPSGPSEVGLGSGDAVSANVDYTPWLDALWGEPVDYWSMIVALESDVDNLMDRVEVLENEVGTLENELEGLISRVDVLENDKGNLLARVEALEIEVAPLKLEVSNLRPSISGLGAIGPQGPPGITSAEIEEMESRIEELETRLSELESSPGTLSAPVGKELEPSPWTLVPGAIAAVVLIGAVVAFYRLRGRPRERPRRQNSTY